MKAKRMLLLFLVGALLINTFSKAQEPDDDGTEDSETENSDTEGPTGDESIGEKSNTEDSGGSDDTDTHGPD